MKKLVSVSMAILLVAFALVAYSQESKLPEGEYDSGGGVSEGPFPFGRFTVRGETISYMGPSNSGRGAVTTEGKYVISGCEIRFIRSGAGNAESVWTFAKKSENVYVIDGIQFTRKQ